MSKLSESLLKLVDQPPSCDNDLVELLPMYYQNALNDMMNLNNAIESENWTDIKLYAHKMKGSALSYGFLLIDQAVREIEIQAKAANIEEVKSLAHFLNEYFKRHQIA